MNAIRGALVHAPVTGAVVAHILPSEDANRWIKIGGALGQLEVRQHEQQTILRLRDAILKIDIRDKAPVTASDPRIPSLPCGVAKKSNLRQAVTGDFFNGLLTKHVSLPCVLLAASARRRHTD